MQKNSGLLIGGIATVLLSFVFGLILLMGEAEQQAAGACSLDAGSSQDAVSVDLSTLPKGPIAGYKGEQLVIAAKIMLAGQRLGLSLRDQQIGVMTGMGESGLVNVGHGDAAGPDSRGVFQQRDNGAWGSLEDRLNPFTAATNFFKALAKVPGRDKLAPTLVAHRVQRNADPYHYEKYWPAAVEVVAALSGVKAGPAILPVGNAGAGDVTNAASVIQRYGLGAVKPHLASLVGILAPKFDIKTVGGYRPSATDPKGHPAGLAADFMVPISPAGKTQGDQLAAFAQANAAQLSIDYIIWYQRIWSVDRASEGWRPMEDRGSPTQNHIDHVHINVTPTPGKGVKGGLDFFGASDCATDATLVGAGIWTAPMKAPITSKYGPRVNPYTGKASFHDGIDYGAGCGTQFRAAASGIVVKAGPDTIYGNQIVIDHGGGIRTKYGHMANSGVLVRVGEQVIGSQIIGLVGSEGWSTGCHLHFTVEVNGKHTDPEKFLANPPAGNPITNGQTIIAAHANIKTTLPTARAAADLRKVLTGRPDFVTLNEVKRRSPGFLTPAGYDMWRSPAATEGNAIIWRADKWKAVATGRYVIVANGPQKWDDGRDAVWVVLQNAQGVRITVISTHHMVNPAKVGPNPQRQQLYGRGMDIHAAHIDYFLRIGAVFLQGDMNYQFGANAGWAPRAKLRPHGMVATFEALGPKRTHDGGGVIDYIFYPAALAKPQAQATIQLNSDHLALVTRFQMGNRR